MWSHKRHFPSANTVERTIILPTNASKSLHAPIVERSDILVQDATAPTNLKENETKAKGKLTSPTEEHTLSLVIYESTTYDDDASTSDIL